MVLVLVIGVFAAVLRRGPERAFWLGFEVGGWAYALPCMIFAPATWSLTRSLFESSLLGRNIGLQLEMERFVFFAFGVHLVVSLALALVAGILASLAWRRWRPLNLIRSA
jgi:hypothetical protein